MTVFIGLLLLVVLAFVGFGFYVNEKYHTLASPLSSSLREIRLETAEAHQLVERILEGDVQSDVSAVWFELDQVLGRFGRISKSRNTPSRCFCPSVRLSAFSITISALLKKLTPIK